MYLFTGHKPGDCCFLEDSESMYFIQQPFMKHLLLSKNSIRNRVMGVENTVPRNSNSVARAMMKWQGRKDDGRESKLKKAPEK